MELGIRRDKWQRQVGIRSNQILVLQHLLTKQHKQRDIKKIQDEIHALEKDFWQELGSFSEVTQIRDIVLERARKDEDDSGLQEAGN